MRMWLLLAMLGGLGGSLPGATIDLKPAGGVIYATAGSTQGWGFEIVNNSAEWISFVSSYTFGETNPALGYYYDYVGPQGGPVNFVLAPGAVWSQTFDLAAMMGFGAYQVDPAAAVGDSTSGLIRTVWDSYATDPAICQCIPAQFSMNLPFEVVIVNTPEPGGGWLMGTGLAVLGLWRLRRYWRRVLMLAATAAPVMAQFGVVQNWNDTFGACGKPGLRVCSNLKCSLPEGNAVRVDPFTAQSNCDMAGPYCTAFKLPQGNPLDVTFLVATDLHLRKGYDITDAQHVKHVAAMNMLPSLGIQWSAAGSGMDPIAIAKPQAVVATGDITNYGHQEELGAYRMLYERGQLVESLQYPMLPGLGNHDLDGECEAANCGRRMFNYVGIAASCAANVDPESHSYSWDWGPYHLVQLNKWVGDIRLGTDTAFQFKVTHPDGIEWLRQDLANSVGNSGRPVIFFQHFGWDDFSLHASDGELWWGPINRQTFLNIIKPYNVVGIFSGHQHRTGMYTSEPVELCGRRLDNFTGGNGGIGGDGQFFAVRLTEKYMDVVPFEWNETENLARPYIVDIGIPYFSRNFFNTGDKGCRRLTGAPPLTAPFTISVTGKTVKIKNNTANTVKGPFALKVTNIHGDTLDNVLFQETCALGPVYTTLDFETLTAGQEVTVQIPVRAASASVYTASDVSVVSLGADSMTVTPGVVTLSSAQTERVDVTTLLGRAIPFTLAAKDSWLAVNSSSNTTPAKLTIKLNPVAASFSRSSTIVIHPTVAGYSDLKVTVNLAAVPVVVSSSLGAPIGVDKATYPSPQTFQWYPGDRHRVVALDRTLAASTVDRFVSWSDSGAADHEIVVPVTGGQYAAQYNRYHKVTSVVIPAGSGMVLAAPASADGFYLAGSQVTVSGIPAKGYSFGSFSGVTPAPAGGQFVWTMDAPLAVTANFSVVGNYLLSTSLGEQVNLTVDGRTYAAPGSFPWVEGSQHQIGVTPVVDGAAGVREVFVQWSDGVATASRTVTAGAVKSYVATYQRQYLLRVTAAPSTGGTLAGGGWYGAGVTARVTSTAASGFLFNGFSGAASGSTNPASVAMNGPASVTGNFRAGTPSLAAVPGPRNTSDPAASRLAFVLNNNGAGAADGVSVTSITAQVVAGSGTVTVGGMPVSFGTIAPGQTASQTLTFPWPVAATRVGFTVRFTANGGAYSGQSTFYVLR
ncbi:InlB B-repeat-containing protein [Paludibaculum fermentans]|uniref:InlB B-repeat-containing protein n=1 Tax=Paludibaculum fermentans TaxID=1473598 RepID=UPI003EBDFB95